MHSPDCPGFYTVGKWPHRYTCDQCAGVGKVKYAGIGSRETPMAVARQMELIGSLFGARGLILRSGRAPRPVGAAKDTASADIAFEAGCNAVQGAKMIRTASTGHSSLGWMEHAARYHPSWDSCNDYAKACHARNSAIMLGDYLNDPVKAVVCWTLGGQVVGGTSQALRVAAAYSIPVFNLAVAGAFDQAMAYV